MASKEFIKEIANGNNKTQVEVKATMDMVEEAFIAKLLRGESFKFADISFSVVDTAERTGRNPATGEVMTIPASKKIVCKPMKGLKDAVKGK